MYQKDSQCMMNSHPLMHNRLDRESGIAIGPILFIIAILAILAAAIAAGSGSFTSGTTNESNSTKASAIIQIGDNLKVGMDRLFMENQVPFANVDTNVANTSGNNQLFSPTGGGITPPAWSMANSPSTDGTSTTGDIWYFPHASVPGVGSGGTNYDILAVLHVSQGVCNDINNKAIGIPTPAVNDLGNFASSANDSTLNGAWPAVLNGHIVGCVQNNDTGSNGFYFYEVIAIQ
jgi:type II secretory pathway pseudopilin PulG